MIAMPDKLFGMEVTVGEPLDLSGYPAAYGLAFDILNGAIGNLACVFVMSDEKVRLPFLVKTAKCLQHDIGAPVVAVCPALSPYQMERLSEEGIAWMVSGAILHIPFLGLSIRMAERARQSARPLSPQAQRLATHIVDGAWTGLSTTEISRLMGKSLSSVSNYFKELEAVVSDAFESHGRRRSVRNLDSRERREVLERLEPYLSNPVESRTFLKFKGVAPAIPPAACAHAGISAVSKKTLLNDNPWPSLATADRSVVKYLTEQAYEVTVNDAPDISLELWRYDLDQKDGSAGDVSLYLSLKKDADDDPRLESALSELIEGVLS